MARRQKNQKTPDTAEINELLGYGHDAGTWQRRLEEQGYTWQKGWKKVIIGQEFVFFKEEISRLLSQPGIRRRDNTLSNSCKSILQVLRGETGIDERDQRLRDRLLFGPESW